MKHIGLTLTLLSIALSSLGQYKTDWFNSDFQIGKGGGAEVESAISRLNGIDLAPIIVAVIDDGVDIDHPDFEGKIWVNEDEIGGNGIDDDANGYIDDVNGWNFLGNPDGENIKYETLELTRLYRTYSREFEGRNEDSIVGNEKSEYEKYLFYKSAFDEEFNEVRNQFSEFAQLAAMYQGAIGFMMERLDSDSISLDVLMSYEPQSEDERQVKNFLVLAETEGLNEYLRDGQEYFTQYLEYNLNVDYDPRGLVNESTMPEGYGNPLVAAEKPDHGTHVAGIIAASRDNDFGIDGIAPNALIMPLRAVPAGDERDKDIAKAIRYAVDNGARIINMSFGKSYSPQADLVFEAIRYAEENDVLMIHAAGNDGTDNDVVINYPDGTLGKKKSAKTWLTVAAMSMDADSTFLADFSNYGKSSVDILAPGVEIRSLAPDGEVKSQSGTSMAAPVVSGVAALVWGINPDLRARDIKKILIKSGKSPGDISLTIDGERTRLDEVVRNPVVVSAKAAAEAALATR